MVSLSSLRERILRGAGAVKSSIYNDPTFAYGYEAPSSRTRNRRGYYMPGTTLPWDALVGDLWMNPAVAANINWAFRNFIMAPPIVQTMNDDGKPETIANHPLPQLLLRPNKVYDYSSLIYATLNSFYCSGDVYWLFERGSGGNITEIWWLPEWRVTPILAKNGREIDHYDYQPGTSKVIPYDAEDVQHIRFGMDPYSPMRGLAPTASLSRDVYALQQATTYTARTFRNFGMVGGVATPKDEQNQFDPQEFVRRWQEKTTGDRQGEMLALNTPMDLQFPNVTPQNMAIETVPDRSEATVCGVLGYATQVVGLHAGRDSKTYANQTEANDQSLQNGLIPVMNIIGMALSAFMLPQMSARWRRQFVTFDVAKIPGMQPDVDAMHERSRADWESGLIDRYDWAVEIGRPPVDSDKGVFYYDLFPKVSGQMPEGAEGSGFGGQGSDGDQGTGDGAPAPDTNSRVARNGSGNTENRNGSTRGLVRA